MYNRTSILILVKKVDKGGTIILKDKLRISGSFVGCFGA